MGVSVKSAEEEKGMKGWEQGKWCFGWNKKEVERWKDYFNVSVGGELDE